MNKLYKVVSNKKEFINEHKNYDVLLRYAKYVGKKHKLFMVFCADGYSFTMDERF